MGAPNMPKDTGEKVTKAQHPYKKGEVDGDKNRYHDMYKHVEEHLITLTRYRDASAADEESTKDIFELIDKYARRRHWKRLAPLLVVALCFEPESIERYVKRCKRQQANGEWNLPCEYVETLWKNNLYDVFDYFNPRFQSRAWRILLSSMNPQQLQRKHRVGRSSSPIESLVHTLKWDLLMELVRLHPELLHYLTYEDNGVNPNPVARALTKKDDTAVKRFVLNFVPMIARKFGPGIFNQRWFKQVWTFPTSVRIPAFSTLAMMPALAGNWMALCELLYVMAMSSYNKLALVSTVFHKFTKSVFNKTKDVGGLGINFSARRCFPGAVCELIWLRYGVRAFKDYIGITNGDGDNLRGVLEALATPENPQARLITKILDDERVMNDGALLEAALSQLKRNVNFHFPPIDPDSLTMLLQAD